MLVKTKHLGELNCDIGCDYMGNLRIWPMNPVDLDIWREDKTKIPPYLLPTDLPPGEFAAAVKRAQDACEFEDNTCEDD